MSGAAPWIVRRAAPWVWGVLLAGWLAHYFAVLAPGEMFRNHEQYTYAQRVIEFRDLLRAGYVAPQWAGDFRGGLGSPYFGYYQPGFFYLASAFAFVMPVAQALGAAVFVLALAGYAGTLGLVRTRFGLAGGVLAATALLLSPYVRAELFIRGDLSEFTGMMLLPPTLHALTTWLDGGGSWSWGATAASAAAMLCSHPVAGLLGYGSLVAVIACWLALGAGWRRALGGVAALAVALLLAAFYLLPLVLEWNLVEGSRVVTATADVQLSFVPLGELFSWRSRPPLWTPFIQWAYPLERMQVMLACIAIATTAWRWRRRTPTQRRLLVALVVVLLGTVWLVTASSSVVWETVWLLRFIQFPWRGLFVLTVVLAALTGCVVERSHLLAAVGIALCVASVVGFRPMAVKVWPAVAAGQDLTTEYVAPDIANEWMPRGAKTPLPVQRPTVPVCAVGSVCQVDRFTRGTGVLRARITHVGRAGVRLPHYYFPVGWHATFEGVPVPLSANADGFMEATIESAAPTTGELDVQFGVTPARRMGLVVSGLTSLALAVGLVAMRRRAPIVASVLALVVVATATSGCRSVGYLVRGGMAEARILWRREPIADVLARPGLDPALRERLALVLQARAFAADPLGLRVGDSFSTFADADGQAVVWVVAAAHRDRLEPYTWWYPVVGKVPYQGYFEREEADRAAAALAATGYDVDVRPASAFSTLGWFADPLLSTTARGAPVTIVETVLHELFHATVYVPSATAFNESAATFVGYRGADAFFCHGPNGDPSRCKETRTRWRRVQTHARVLRRYARRLAGLYAAGLPAPERERRRAALAAGAARAVARRGLGSGDELSPPNNARLLAMLAYETDLDAFERLAPSAEALPDAVRRIVVAARGAADPLAAVRALDANMPLQTRGTRLDSDLSWLRSLSPSTSCSDVWPAGFASSGTTSPTGRTCMAPVWWLGRGATAG